MQKSVIGILKSREELGTDKVGYEFLLPGIYDAFDTIHDLGRQYWNEGDSVPIEALPDGIMKELLEPLASEPFSNNKIIREFVRNYNSTLVDVAKEDIYDLYKAVIEVVASEKRKR